VSTLVAKEQSWSHSSNSRSWLSHSCELLELPYGTLCIGCIDIDVWWFEIVDALKFVAALQTLQTSSIFMIDVGWW
jgi:hypothetical protein